MSAGSTTPAREPEVGAREEQPEERDLGGGAHGGQDIMRLSPNGDFHGPGVRDHRGDARPDRRRSRPWTYEVTTTSVRAFARGVGYTDPVYFDVAAAKKRRLPEPAGAADVPRHAGLHPRPLHDTFSGPIEAGPA